MFRVNNHNLRYREVEKLFIIFDNPSGIKATIIQKSKSNHFLSLCDDILHENDLSLFQLMPKKFTITTKTGSCDFNVDMLIHASSVIKEAIQTNPNHLQYHIDIKDSTNILQKFELLFQNKKVTFEKAEFPIFEKIVEILQLENSFYTKKAFSNKIFQGFNISKRNYLLNISIFTNFLKLKNHRTFKISTNKKTYDCNKFGILSSSVLADLISKDSELNHYEYENESGDFQIICDFFNFNEISITQKNVDYVKEIAEDLKINYLIEKVDKIISELDKISEKIDDSQTVNESADFLFDLLYKIKEMTVEKVFNSILTSEWIKTEESVQELAAFILQVIKTDINLHPYLIDLLERLNKASEEKEHDNLKILIPFIVKILMNLFGESNAICSFIYNLYKKGFIKLDEIVKTMKKVIVRNDNVQTMCINSWFLPELIDNELFNEARPSYNKYEMLQRKKIKNNSKKEESNFYSFIDFYQKNIEIYKQMRDKGEPDDEITKALRCDDVDKLQSILSRNEDDISDDAVPFNMFDDFASNVRIRYINYAAAHGSIKCFKYLLLNHQTISENTFQFAIFGGNIEIIKIIDQTPSEQITNENNYLSELISKMEDDNKGILIAINKHKNDIFDWIFDNKLDEKDKTPILIQKIINQSAKSGNIHALITAIDNGFDILNDKANVLTVIQLASQNGFFKYTTFLSNIIENKLHMKSSGHLLTMFHQTDQFDTSSFVSFGNLDIFKIGETFISDYKNCLGKSLTVAALKNYPKIIKYILSKSEEKSISENDKVNALCNSLTHDSLDTFEYLMEQFNFYEKVGGLSSQNYRSILRSAISNNKIEIVKKIVNVLLKKLKNEDFTMAFLQSLQDGSSEICHYFIDEKLSLNYAQISSRFNNHGNNSFNYLDSKIFTTIYDNIDSELREKFSSNSLIFAIRQQNVQLVDHLLSMNISYDKILLDAVRTNVEIVKTVIKYKNHPSFINRRTNEGSALCIASRYNRIEIVEFLLSVPGINVNVFDNNDAHIFRFMITNNRIEILELFLKTGKVDINCNSFLSDAIQNRRKEIAELILKYPTTDINARNLQDLSPLILAVKQDYLSIVDYILNDERFDPEESRFIDAFFASKGEVLMHISQSKYFDVNRKIIYNSKIMNTDPYNRNYISFGAKPTNNNNNEYKTPLIHAINLHNLDLINVIINHPSFDIEKSDLGLAFYTSIKENDIDIFKKLIEAKNVDINTVKYKDHRIFQIVLSKFKFELFNVLLNDPRFKPSELDIQMAFIRLIKSQYSNSNEVIKQLIEYVKAHENVFDFNKILPYKFSLFTSISKKSKDLSIVELFLENGADPNIPDEYGVYPLEYAISLESLEFVNMLLNSNKIDYNQKIPIKNSLVAKITPDLVDEYFSMNDIEVHHSNNFNNYMKTKNIDQPKSNPFKNLFKKNSHDIKPKDDNNDVKNDKFCSYLHLAAKSQVKEILKEFLDRKLIDVNVKDYNGDTPLIAACRSILKDNISLLLSVDDIDYQHRNNEGKDALEILAEYRKHNTPKMENNSKEEYCQQIMSLFDSNNNIGVYKFDPKTENQEEMFYPFAKKRFSAFKEYCDSKKENKKQIEVEPEKELETKEKEFEKKLQQQNEEKLETKEQKQDKFHKQTLNSNNYNSVFKKEFQPFAKKIVNTFKVYYTSKKENKKQIEVEPEKELKTKVIQLKEEEFEKKQQQQNEVKLETKEIQPKEEEFENKQQQQNEGKLEKKEIQPKEEEFEKKQQQQNEVKHEIKEQKQDEFHKKTLNPNNNNSVFKQKLQPFAKTSNNGFSSNMNQLISNKPIKFINNESQVVLKNKLIEKENKVDFQHNTLVNKEAKFHSEIELDKKELQMKEEELEKKSKQQKEIEKEIEIKMQMQKDREKELDERYKQIMEKEKELEMKEHQQNEKEKELEMKEKQQNEKLNHHDDEYERFNQYLEDENSISPYEMQIDQTIQQQWQFMMQSEYIRQANFENQMKRQTQFLHNLLDTKNKKKKNKSKNDK